MYLREIHFDRPQISVKCWPPLRTKLQYTADMWAFQFIAALQSSIPCTDQAPFCSFPLVDTKIVLHVSSQNSFLSLPRHNFSTAFPIPKHSCTISAELLVFISEASNAKVKYLSKPFLYFFICGFRVHLQNLKKITTTEQIQCYAPHFRFLAASSEYLVHQHTGWMSESSPQWEAASAYEFSSSKMETF